MPINNSNKICNLCNNTLISPIKSVNSDANCFLCLMYNFMINKLANSENNYIWLYSSNYNEFWWCYDKSQNLQIENTYKDFLLKQNSVKNDDISIKIKINKSKENHKYDISKINFHAIDIESDEETKLNFTDEYIIESTNIVPISYIMQIQSTEYKLDFDSMKQINLSELWKKRSIKRLTIPSSTYSFLEIITYLKSQNVIGITGTKFK